MIYKSLNIKVNICKPMTLYQLTYRYHIDLPALSYNEETLK